METLKEIAKTLVENVDFEAKTYRWYFGIDDDHTDMTMEVLQQCISSNNFLDDIHQLMEFMVALALLDGTIVLDDANPWRLMSESPFEDVPLDIKEGNGAVHLNVINAGGFIESVDHPLSIRGAVRDYSHWRLHVPDPNPWRRIEDEEPPKDESFFLVRGYRFHFGAGVTPVCLAHWDGEFRSFDGAGNGRALKSFTHWMPQPELPKEIE